MKRKHLLGAASAAALAIMSAGAIAAPAPAHIVGGGSTLAEFDYFHEFSLFNGAKGTKYDFTTYYAVGSGAGQKSLINNDCTQFALPAGSCTVDYGASDATLNSTQAGTWATSTVGQSVAGDLIQVPSMGTPVSFPIVNSAVTTNGGLTLNDTQLCGIFSGKITDWSGVSGAITPGTITVVYRSDGSGTSFLLTNHLSAVCNSSNSNITFFATTSFASLFPNSTPPSNFQPETGSQGIADYLNGLNGPVTSAMSYLTPDFTTLFPKSDAFLINGAKSTLVAAQVTNSVDGKTYLPTVANTTTGLGNPGAGSTNPNPPTNATDGANPLLWVPLLPIVNKGYPVVGYTTFDFAQCYAPTVAGNPASNVASGIILFMQAHYTNTTLNGVQNNNGFVKLANTPASKIQAGVLDNLLANKSGWNDNIQNPTACATKAGRGSASPLN